MWIVLVSPSRIWTLFKNMWKCTLEQCLLGKNTWLWRVLALDTYNVAPLRSTRLGRTHGGAPLGCQLSSTMVEHNQVGHLQCGVLDRVRINSLAFKTCYLHPRWETAVLHSCFIHMLRRCHIFQQQIHPTLCISSS